MNVAFVHPPFETIPPLSAKRTTASLMVWTNQIAQRLAREHHVLVYSPGDGTFEGTVYDSDIEYRYVDVTQHKWERRVVNGMMHAEAIAGYPQPKRPILATQRYYPNYIEKVARDLSREHWDIIHVTEMAQYVPVLKRYNPDARIVLHNHQYRLAQYDRALVHEQLQEADLILAVSRSVTQALRDRFPEYADRCETLYNGVDAARFRDMHLNHAKPDPEYPRLLFVGRISPEKGVHVLIDAFARLAEKHPRAELDLVGGISSVGYHYIIPMSDDPNVQALSTFYHPVTKRDRYKGALDQLVPDHIRDRIHFHGQIPNSRLEEYLRKATAFVFPSVWEEPFSIALIEGQASGVPVVATRAGGNLELMVDGETGLLVERNNADALADALERLIADPALGERLGKAAQARIKDLFTWDQCAENLLNYYAALLEQADPIPAYA
ncbi:MAG: glycosyltransferase family 4 protein [Anaerolineae bacterium]|nr:glycosyltransferase family 4 protein [Anaerolineae bacterium]